MTPRTNNRNMRVEDVVQYSVNTAEEVDTWWNLI
jgi:hypothetical protein